MIQDFYISVDDIQHASLREDECQIFTGTVDDFESRYDYWWSLLSSDECKRATSFKFEKDKKTFVIAHAILRKILSFYFNVKPDEIFFLNEQNGKPFVQSVNVVSKQTDIQFNLSHSANGFAIAIQLHLPVGIDMEKIVSQQDHSIIVSDFFTIEEKAAIAAAPNPTELFYYIWTKKEAIAKMNGEGIADLAYVKLPEHYCIIQFAMQPFVASVCIPQTYQIKHFYLNA
jgi:4'-phosphopantetheinyl transferase